MSADNYTTKDSGKREEFGAGAVRDSQSGKPRYDLMPTLPLRRVAELYARGAEKYAEVDEINWIKGIPTSRILASLMRHLEAARAGEQDEDHLAAVVWNALAWMYFQGTDWDDLNKLWNRE